MALLTKEIQTPLVGSNEPDHNTGVGSSSCYRKSRMSISWPSVTLFK